MAASQPLPLSIREEPVLELNPEPLPVSAGLTFRAVGLGSAPCRVFSSPSGRFTRRMLHIRRS